MLTDITFGPKAFGVEIIESIHATKRVEDWSQVRSPGRAARRLKRGFRQNIVVRQEPAAFQVEGKMVVHPSILKEMQRRMAKQIDADLMRRMTFGAFGY